MGHKRGYTLIELVLVIFLLLFIAMAVFSLTGIGSQSYSRLVQKQDVQSDLRVGLSYLDVRMKQHDVSGAVTVMNAPFANTAETARPVLRIQRSYADVVYNLWIYEYDGYLCELLTRPDADITAEMGSRIVAMDQVFFDHLTEDTLQVRMSRRSDSGVLTTQTRTFTLRSEGESS
ncbi:MAG: DUF4860 domain-containing protein [Eubacteriales bacterium]|nr:DUF4860 domain-containing protein [Eubacteriales bacterium]